MLEKYAGDVYLCVPPFILNVVLCVKRASSFPVLLECHARTQHVPHEVKKSTIRCCIPLLLLARYCLNQHWYQILESISKAHCEILAASGPEKVVRWCDVGHLPDTVCDQSVISDPHVHVLQRPPRPGTEQSRLKTQARK